MLMKNCPCDIDGICPYISESYGSCEYWCSEEPEYGYGDDGETE